MKKIIPLVFLLIASSLFAQNKPFPQGLNYPGCIKPTVAQNILDTDVSSYYTYWKTNYLKNDLVSLPTGYYVLGDITGTADGASGTTYSSLGSSEGQGYGMIITALIAGFDPNAQTYFDGLFATLRKYKSVNNPNLMGWVVADAAASQGDFDSATDGDIDIAYALLLAHYQWGSAGTINYLDEATKMITDGIKVSNVTNGNRLNLGDWDSKTAQHTRPSDWMMSHMRAFAAETNDATWTDVITNLYSVYNSFSTTYSPNTGLVTDFIIKNPPEPCPTNFLDEYPETNTYSYNACRFPLRIVMDYAMYGSIDAKKISNKLVNWVKTKTNNDPTKIKDGYNLSGGATGSGSEAVFIAPFVAASVINSNNQTFLDSGWQTIKNKQEDYFNDSYNLLCMLFISGNWWIPQSLVTDLKKPIVLSKEVSVNPNPSNDLIFITMENAQLGAKSINIINGLGKSVLEKQDYIFGEYITVSDLLPDVYFVKIVTEKQVYVQRFVKQ